MIRVAGADPGTSSLDLLVLEDGVVADQARFSAEQLRADPSQPVAWLREHGPFHLIAGPSGYGLPLRSANSCTTDDRALMTLVRPDEGGRGQGVLGFGRLLRELCASSLPVIFLPGVIHLPTVPAHRKVNRLDLGTPDKLCVAALALAQLGPPYQERRFCVVELGSAFTAVLAIDAGRVVDGVGGTSGPIGWRSGGAWDGEAAYLLSPLSKNDLFQGGAASIADPAVAERAFREGVIKAVAALHAVTPFDQIVLSGRLLETQPTLGDAIRRDLEHGGSVRGLTGLPGAWVKHAAQGAALLADGLAGGTAGPLVEHLRLREARGTVLDDLTGPRADDVRAMFGMR